MAVAVALAAGASAAQTSSVTTGTEAGLAGHPFGEDVAADVKLEQFSEPALEMAPRNQLKRLLKGAAVAALVAIVLALGWLRPWSIKTIEHDNTERVSRLASAERKCLELWPWLFLLCGCYLRASNKRLWKSSSNSPVSCCSRQLGAALAARGGATCPSYRCVSVFSCCREVPRPTPGRRRCRLDPSVHGKLCSPGSAFRGCGRLRPRASAFVLALQPDFKECVKKHVGEKRDLAADLGDQLYPKFQSRDSRKCLT